MPGFAESSALFRAVLDLPPELRALQGHVDPVFLRYAAARAEALGIGADAVVARSGVIHPDAMLQAYAADLGTGIDLLEETAPEPVEVEEILAGGFLRPGSIGGKDHPVIALGQHTRQLYALLSQQPALAERIKLTSPERLRAFAARASADRRAHAAAFGLLERYPALSAEGAHRALSRSTLLAPLAACAFALYFFPRLTLFAIEALLAGIFIAWAMLRLFACFSGRRSGNATAIRDDALPVYTILVPLHREARVAGDLVRSLSALHYPREKLDVKLILETDDAETIAAVQAIQLDPCFEIVFAPPVGPRTKPKALRAALPFARGEFLVIYDAEDRPHPDQLRMACEKFAAGPPELACVQAKLAVDNIHPGFLTAHFRAEYSGLFEVLLPALARLRLPLPLGGTSNHFRTRVLREVGAWDPHNVTEDADLGIRLARFGHRTDVVNSTTWEEAPARLGAWLPQRTRWMKGFLQTYVVHMRAPGRLLKELGPRGFLAFQLLIGAPVLAALVHPVFVAWLMIDAAFGPLLAPADSVSQWLQKGLVFVTLFSGYLASALLAFTGMRRCGAYASALVLLTIPVYWLFLAAAAWRALWKFIVAPHQWEKTAHGIARRRELIR